MKFSTKSRYALRLMAELARYAPKNVQEYGVKTIKSVENKYL